MHRNPDRGASSFYALDCTLENLELKLGEQGIADEVKKVIWKYEPLQLIRAILFIHASDEHLIRDAEMWEAQFTDLDDDDAFNILDIAWEHSSKKALELGDYFRLPSMTDEQKKAFSHDAHLGRGLEEISDEERKALDNAYEWIRQD